MTDVLNVTKEQLSQMEKFYIDDIKPNTNEYVMFAVKSLPITAYFSGKVVFQGNKAKADYDMWIKMFNLEDELASKEAIYYSSSIGSDEVGKGDYFGPLVVCACYVDDYAMNKVRELRISDSKKRTDDRIIKIAKEILHHVKYSVLTLSNEKYNELSKNNMSVTKMMTWLHNKAITNLISKINKDVPVYIDQFTEPKTYYRYLQGQDNVYKNANFTTKAESKHSSVACASIIARYKYLKEMDRLSKESGYTLPKGGGKQVDEMIAKIISEKGEKFLHTIGKTTFRNTEKAKILFAENKKL